MYCEDFFAIFESWEVDRDTTVKSSRSEECLIENISTVSCCHDDDVGFVIKSIHLSEDLIECLLSFIMTTSDTRRTFFPDRIDLVDKYNTWSSFTSFLEEVTYTRSSYSNKHLDELRTRNREKWNITLPCDSTSKQSLSCTWRSLKQDTTRDFGSEIFILTRIFEKIHHFYEIGFFLLRSGHVLKGNFLIEFRIVYSSSRSDKCHRSTHPASTHTGHEEK